MDRSCTMRISYLGPEGTFGEEAARAFRPDATLVPLATIPAVLDALVHGAVERAFLPLDSISAGPVGETLDVLYGRRDDVLICDVQVMRVRHAIGSFGDAGSVRVVRSRDNTLAQCASYLTRHYPNAEREGVASTSRAIADLAESRDPSVAAIGNPRAMERYGLPILERDVSDSADNMMRFILLARRGDGFRVPTGRDVTSIVLAPPADRAGLLLDALSVVSGAHGLNVSALHTRPDGRGGLRFFVDIEGHMDDANVEECLKALEHRLAHDRITPTVLGSYPRRPFIAGRIKSIGIIGGTGAMGQWLKTMFAGAGYDVLIAGRNTDLTYEECVAHANVVLINVPIKHTPEVIANVAPLMTRGQVLVDNTSIKLAPVAAMLEHAPDGVEVLGMHTVFGPSAPSLRGQNVIFTRTARSGRRSEEFEKIFYKHGARVTYASGDQHDRQMALHQNLEHFTKLVLAEVISGSVDDANDLSPFASPNSRASLATMGRVLHADLDLIGQIQTLNTYGPAAIRRYVEVASRLADAIENGDMDAVYRSLESSAGKLGHAFLSAMLARSRAFDEPID